MKKVVDIKGLSQDELSSVVELLMRELGVELHEIESPRGPSKYLLKKTEQKKASLLRRRRLNQMVVDHARAARGIPVRKRRS